MSTEQISNERYDVIMGRFEKYLEALNDPTKDPVNVFDPLSIKRLQELEMIRVASRELQAKKDEDVKKAAQAKEEKVTAAEKKGNETEKEAPAKEESKE